MRKRPIWNALSPVERLEKYLDRRFAFRFSEPTGDSNSARALSYLINNTRQIFVHRNTPHFVSHD